MQKGKEKCHMIISLKQWCELMTDVKLGLDNTISAKCKELIVSEERINSGDAFPLTGRSHEKKRLCSFSGRATLKTDVSFSKTMSTTRMSHLCQQSESTKPWRIVDLKCVRNQPSRIAVCRHNDAHRNHKAGSCHSLPSHAKVKLIRVASVHSRWCWLTLNHTVFPFFSVIPV